MSTVPRTLSAKLQYFITHAPVWLANAEAIGSSVEEIEMLAAKIETAKALLRAQGEAQIAARSATAMFNDALDEVSLLGMNVILRARIQATIDGRGIYALAAISAPDKGSPIGKPGTPTRFRSTVRQEGTVVLRWSCKNPRGSTGTMYHVSRQLGYTGPFEFLASVGKREFVDLTLPTGVSDIIYQVQAVRSTAKGDKAKYPMQFGHGPAELKFNQLVYRTKNDAA